MNYDNYSKEEQQYNTNNIKQMIKKQQHTKSTSLNTGPFSIHQLAYRLQSARPKTSTSHHYNAHNKKIIKSFQKNINSSKKSEKLIKTLNQKFPESYLEIMKDLEKTTKNNNFTTTKINNNFFLERKKNKYDGFESFNVPKVENRCSTAGQHRPVYKDLYGKNYSRLVSAVTIKHNANDDIENEKVIENYCKQENQKLQRIIQGNNKINELSRGVKLSNLMTPSIQNIISAPKIMIKRTGVGGASRQMGDHYTPGLVVITNKGVSMPKRNCFGGAFQY